LGRYHATILRITPCVGITSDISVGLLNGYSEARVYVTARCIPPVCTPTSCTPTSEYVQCSSVLPMYSHAGSDWFNRSVMYHHISIARNSELITRQMSELSEVYKRLTSM
jgi:hypothetical protein